MEDRLTLAVTHGKHHGEISSTVLFTDGRHVSDRRAEYFGRWALCVHVQRTRKRLRPDTGPQRRRPTVKELRDRTANTIQADGKGNESHG